MDLLDDNWANISKIMSLPWNANFWQVGLLDVVLSQYPEKSHNFTNLIFNDVTLQDSMLTASRRIQISVDGTPNKGNILEPYAPPKSLFTLQATSFHYMPPYTTLILSVLLLLQVVHSPLFFCKIVRLSTYHYGWPSWLNRYQGGFRVYSSFGGKKQG